MNFLINSEQSNIYQHTCLLEIDRLFIQFPCLAKLINWCENPIASNVATPWTKTIFEGENTARKKILICWNPQKYLLEPSKYSLEPSTICPLASTQNHANDQLQGFYHPLLNPATTTPLNQCSATNHLEVQPPHHNKQD